MPRIVLLTAATATAVAVIFAPAGARPDRPAAHASSVRVVKFGEYFFTPKRITIRRGDRVRFTNVGRIEHTVADSTKNGTIRSRVIRPRPLAPGRSQTVTFRRRGTIYYLCTFHPTMMRGVIVVR